MCHVSVGSMTHVDGTATRVWDSGRLLHSLLACETARSELGISPPSRILELGAGTGELAAALAATLTGTREYIATDGDPASLELIERAALTKCVTSHHTPRPAPAPLAARRARLS
jgi:methylase of polypeptide subunit release factors